MPRPISSSEFVDVASGEHPRRPAQPIRAQSTPPKEGFKDGSPNCNQLRTGSGLQAEQNVKGEAGPAVSELPNMQSYPVLLSIFCNHRRSVNLIIGRDMNVIHPPC